MLPGFYGFAFYLLFKFLMFYAIFLFAKYVFCNLHQASKIVTEKFQLFAHSRVMAVIHELF